MEYISNMRQRAQQRNWFKLRVCGSYINPTIATQKELELVDKINQLRKELISNFDEEGRKLGFIIPNVKCYDLRCKGKVIGTVILDNYGPINVCKKHKKEWEEVGGN